MWDDEDGDPPAVGWVPLDRPNIADILALPRSSVGLGGIGPDGMNDKFSIGVDWMTASGSIVVSRSDMPIRLGTPRKRCKDGRRRSTSISRTRFPSRARPDAVAKLVVDLPSLACVLVTRIDLGSPPIVE